jgi:type II secretory pathway pseudopilin PulG
MYSSFVHSDKHSSKAFSLIELLITFVLIALIIAFIVPQYINIQRNANIQIAQQQVDAMRKAILAWSAAQPSLSAVDSAYGNNSSMSTAAWNAIGSSYLDPSFVSRINVVTSGGTVSYFTTNEMNAITGGIFQAQTYTANGITSMIPLPSSSPTSGGQTTAFGVIFWPTGSAGRRTSQPTVVLFVPTGAVQSVGSDLFSGTSGSAIPLP